MPNHRPCGCVEQHAGRDCPACRGTGLIPPVSREEWEAALAVVEAARLALPLLQAPTAADAGEFLYEAQRMASALRGYDEAER